MSKSPGAGADKESPRRRRAAPEPSPAQRALGLLVRREHSRKELTRKLQLRGVEPEEATAAAERMAEAGWQDDARFAGFLVRNRAAQGHGPVRIRAELATHGLDEAIVQAAMESHEGDWQESANTLVARRFGPALRNDRALQRKAGEFLLRRGFTMEQMRHATNGDAFDDLESFD